uniref:Uncharacterized protein n=1 Tax=Arundo donax TaxID=35708 RepID=A0A0A9AQS5_ARUDO
MMHLNLAAIHVRVQQPQTTSIQKISFNCFIYTFSSKRTKGREVCETECQRYQQKQMYAPCMIHQ